MGAKSAGRSTRRWREVIRPAFKAQCEAEQAPCWLCGRPIDYSVTDIYDDAVWEPDHFYPVSTHTEHGDDPANLRASHRGCNRARGNKKAANLLGTTSRDWFARRAGKGDPNVEEVLPWL